MNGRPARLRATVRIAYGAVKVVAVLLAVGLIAGVLAPLIIRGPCFGRVVGWILPRTRGTITVGGGRWTWGAVWALTHGRPGAVLVENVRITDPEGTEVLRVGRATAAVEVTRDHTRLIVHDLRVTGAAWRFAQMKRGRDTGFLAAFQPARRTAAARPPHGGGLTSFAIASAELIGLDATFDFPTWGLTLANVHARGDLGFGPEAPATAGVTPPGASAPTIFTFNVANVDLRNGGLLRVLAGRARTEFPFSTGRIVRVATTAAAPDAILIEANAIATQRSRLALTGSFTGVYGLSRPRQPTGIDLHARFTDAADVVEAILTRRSPAPPMMVGGLVGGRDADLTLAFSGSFDRLAIEADARGFDVRLRDLAFLDSGFHLSLETAPFSARLTGLTFTSPEGGRLSLDAAIERRRVRGALALDRFSVTPYLPTFLRSPVGGILDGRFRGEVDLAARSASVDTLALTLARPRGAWGPRRLRLNSGGSPAPSTGQQRDTTLVLAGARYADGTLTVPEFSVPLAGGRVTARARVVLTDPSGRLQPPIVDLTARAERISFERLVGSTFATGALTFRTRARGTLDDLTVDVTVPPGDALRVFGEPCQLPASTVVHLADDNLSLSEFRLRCAHGATIGLAGHISLAGRLALALEVRDFPLGKLPALAEADLPLSGRLSGRLDASGSVRTPLLGGRLSIDDATFNRRPIGGGTLTVTATPAGGVHAEGQVIDGVTLDGTMVAREEGLRGLATLRLDDLRLDPFLSALPGGARATGVVTGVLEARVAPGQPASAEARLSALALTIDSRLPRGPGSLPRGPRAGGGVPATRHTFALHSVNEIRASARAGGGPIRIGPARFAGDAGSVELQGESDHGRVQAALHGRLALGAMAPLVSRWVGRLSGDLDFDLAAAVAGASALPVVTGTIGVATPVVFRVPGIPFDARLASGSLRLTADGITRVDLPLTLGTGTLRIQGTVTSSLLSFMGAGPQLALDLAGDLDGHLLALAAPSTFAWARGGARIDAHLTGTPAQPTVRARMWPAGLTLALRALPDDTIAIAGGPIDLDDHKLVVNDVRIGVNGGGAAGGGARKVQVTVGGAPDGVATLEIGSLFHPRPLRVALPVRGRITATAVPPVVIDDLGFALRLDGYLFRRTRLAGEVVIVKAHVPPSRGKSASQANSAKPVKPLTTTAGASSALPAWLTRSPLAQTELDVWAHSHDGALTVELRNLPDVHVDLDYHLRGTVAHPQAAGRIRGADAFSNFALLLQKIFR